MILFMESQVKECFLSEYLELRLCEMSVILGISWFWKFASRMKLITFNSAVRCIIIFLKSFPFLNFSFERKNIILILSWNFSRN